jgi:hypothetical protein
VGRRTASQTAQTARRRAQPRARDLRINPAS